MGERPRLLVKMLSRLVHRRASPYAPSPWLIPLDARESQIVESAPVLLLDHHRYLRPTLVYCLHQHVTAGMAQAILLALFHPASGQVRVKGVLNAPNAVLHPWLEQELTAILAPCRRLVRSRSSRNAPHGSAGKPA